MEAYPEAASRALAAYGGESFWREARSVKAVVSASGLAFALKRQSPFDRIHVQCAVGEPLARLIPIDRSGNTGILKNGDVFLESPSPLAGS